MAAVANQILTEFASKWEKIRAVELGIQLWWNGRRASAPGRGRGIGRGREYRTQGNALLTHIYKNAQVNNGYSICMMHFITIWNKNIDRFIIYYTNFIILHDWIFFLSCIHQQLTETLNYLPEYQYRWTEWSYTHAKQYNKFEHHSISARNFCKDLQKNLFSGLWT